MKRKICFIFELLLKIATIIFAFWGVCLQARDDGGFIRSNTYLFRNCCYCRSVYRVANSRNDKRKTNYFKTVVCT